VHDKDSLVTKRNLIMSQSIILHKLARFLELTNKTATLPLCEDLHTSEGHCQGFSVCFAAMNLIDKLDWWEAAINAVALWDENPSTLKKKIKLPNGDSDETYAQIFERVLNYIVFYQVDTDSQFYPNIKINRINWNKIFIPGSKYFDILCPDKKIRRIKERKTAAGFFTVNQLNHLLDPSLMSETMCFVYSPVHVITVSYKKPNWILYDPNYDHDVPVGQPIHKTFKTKKSLINEILKIQGNSLAIVYAAFKEERKILFPQVDEIIKLKASTLLKEHGLEIICAYAATLLPKILKQSTKSRQTADVIADGIVAHDSTGWTGLHIIIRLCPRLLPLILEYCSESSKCATSIALALSLVEHSTNKTGLDMLVEEAANYLPLILSYVEQSTKGKDLIAFALAHQSEVGITGLYKIAKYAPHYLPRILDYISQSNHAPDALAMALAVKSPEGESGWDFVVNRYPLCERMLSDILLKGFNSIQSSHLNDLREIIKHSTVNNTDRMTRSSAAFFKKYNTIEKNHFLTRILDELPSGHASKNWRSI